MWVSQILFSSRKCKDGFHIESGAGVVTTLEIHALCCKTRKSKINLFGINNNWLER